MAQTRYSLQQIFLEKAAEGWLLHDFQFHAGHRESFHPGLRLQIGEGHGGQARALQG
jgi:hypothetical protein